MLTDANCKNAKCPLESTRVRLSDYGGLYLEITRQSKRWFWKYRHDGKERRMSLGVYPAVGLAAARADRDDARTMLKTGADPVAARQVRQREERRQAAEHASNTFESVAGRWYEHWRGAQTVRHAEYVRRRLEADVYPAIGARPIGEITARELVAMA